MEFGSTPISQIPVNHEQSSRQSHRPLSRNQAMKALKMVESSSSDDDNDVSTVGDKHRGVRAVNGSSRSRMQRIFDRQRKEEEEEDREKQQDQLLKELGLFEDGLTKDQKRELLMVIEESKESAKMEASIRENEEWESEVMVINESFNELESTVPLNGSLLPSPSKKEKMADLVTVGDSDDETRMAASQDLFSYSQNEQDQISSQEDTHNLDLSGDIFVNQQTSDEGYSKNLESTVRSGRLLTRLTRKRPAQQEKKLWAMDAILSIWTPQKTAIIEEFLLRKTTGQLVDEVPYYCPSGFDPSIYTKSILKDVNRYHAQLQLVQCRTLAPIPWGDPILLGRSRLLSRYCNLDIPASLETKQSEDDPQSFPDLEEWPLEGKSDPVAETSAQQSKKSIHVPEPIEDRKTNQKEEEDIFVILNRSPSPECTITSVCETTSAQENKDNVAESPPDDLKVCSDAEETSLNCPNLSHKFRALETEFKIVPKIKLADEGGSKPLQDDDFQIKPKQIRKRNQNEDGNESTNSKNKKPKCQAKNKYASLIKSLYIPLQRVELSTEYKKYAGSIAQWYNSTDR